MENILKANKRGQVGGQVAGVFLLVLVLAVIVGMTFLFTAQLKTQVQTTSGGTGTTAYQAVNNTEKAGADLVNYIPLVFLAIIFGVILVVVLRVLMPYVGATGNW